jgi:hypothetical protein
MLTFAKAYPERVTHAPLILVTEFTLILVTEFTGH